MKISCQYVILQGSLFLLFACKCLIFSYIALECNKTAARHRAEANIWNKRHKSLLMRKQCCKDIPDSVTRINTDDNRGKSVCQML